MRVVLSLVLVALLAGCAADPAAEAPDGTDNDTQPEEDNEAEQPEDDDTEGESLTGTLDGDPQLEGGCVWLDAGTDRYEILWPEEYEADADPVRLLRNGEVVAEAGDQVTVVGQEAEDMMSVCQVGPIFDAVHVEVASP